MRCHTHATHAVTSGQKGTTSASVALSETQTVTTPDLFDHPDLFDPLLKHVPRSSRASCGNLLANILNNITAQPSNIKYWRDLFSFGSDILAKPNRGDITSATFCLQKRMESYSDKSTSGAPPVRNISNPVRRIRETYLLPRSRLKSKTGISRPRSASFVQMTLSRQAPPKHWLLLSQSTHWHLHSNIP